MEVQLFSNRFAPVQGSMNVDQASALRKINRIPRYSGGIHPPASLCSQQASTSFADGLSLLIETDHCRTDALAQLHTPHNLAFIKLTQILTLSHV